VDDSQNIQLLPFKPEDQAEVKKLILNGLVEHWGVLDPDKNPDLNHIASSYENAVFIVAWCNGRIVGTGALVSRPNHTAEIVRMSVDVDMRRSGVGTRILHHLIHTTKQQGSHQVILETTSTWSGVIAFYCANQFKITHTKDGDTFFALDL